MATTQSSEKTTPAGAFAAADLPPAIRSALAGLRWRIRGYVLLEGLALTVIWLGVTFWLGFLVDYGPVLMGANELPVAARAVLLAGVVLVSLLILWRWVIRRVVVRLRDESMALLLERQFENFHDSLLTAVEFNAHPHQTEDYNPEMLAHTNVEAQQVVNQIRYARVFRFGPLARNLGGATVILLSFVLFFLFAGEAMATWASRMFLLDSTPWARRAHIEMDYVEVVLPAADGASPQMVRAEFDENRRVKVARGTSLVIHVRADVNAETVPEVCSLLYRTADGGRDRVNMNKIGGPREGYQNYRFDGKPFRGVIADTTFDIIGFDHRLRDYGIEVVESPAVILAELDCIYPDYLVDPDTGAFTPGTLELSPGTRVPQGTRVLLRLTANKDLKHVVFRDPVSGEVSEVPAASSETPRLVEFDLGEVKVDTTFEVSLHDVDGVLSEQPYRFTVGSTPDEAPVVESQLQGIGTAITPEAIVPMVGRIRDDYDVEQAWFEVTAGEGAARKIGLPLSKEQFASSVDFREERRAGRMKLEPKSQVTLVVRADDRFNLGGAPNTGTGDIYELEVVTPEELLSRLDVRELGLRRRFELIVEETRENRDSILRVRNIDTRATGGGEPGDSAGAEPEDTAAEPGDSNAVLENARAKLENIRKALVQQSQQASLKSSQETLGIAVSFDDIRQELINNRVDSEDRKSRLSEEIIAPLRKISDEMFPVLDERLKKLEAELTSADRGAAAADEAMRQADAILLAMDNVLQRMLELEDFNELVEILRSLIKESENLTEQTKQRQKEQALELLQ